MLLFTVLDRRFGWLSTTEEFDVSPERLLDLLALIAATAGLHALRSLHRASGSPNLVIAASILFASTLVVLVGIIGPAFDSSHSWAYAAAAGGVGVLTVAAMFEAKTFNSFSIYLVLAIASCAVAMLPIGAVILVTNGSASSTALLEFLGLVVALSALALTLIGLRKHDVFRQILGLLVLALAPLAIESAATDVTALVHKATFAGLLATVAIHASVELRNLSMAAQSTTERAEADLTATNGLLQQHREERAQLIHDSRNALLVIQAGLQSIATDESEQLIASLRSELDRIQAMIERNHSPVEAIDLVETFAPMFQCYESVGVTLDLRALDASHTVVLASRTKLVEVMQNLVENALRHSHSIAPIDIDVTAAGGFASIEVRDHGAGIDARNRLRASQRVVSLSGIGSGRGLSICQRLVEQMNGTLEFFAADDGPGTIFRVQLPLATATAGVVA